MQKIEIEEDAWEIEDDDIEIWMHFCYILFVFTEVLVKIQESNPLIAYVVEAVVEVRTHEMAESTYVLTF